MAALNSTLRSNFEKEVIKARDEAESAAQAALATLAVERDRPFDSMGEEKRGLRRALRARARQLGEGDMGAGMPRLIEEIAYEQWHRMLFARFLAENDLLMHPEGVAVTLEECAELAQEEGAEDLWAVATRYASLMLPGIFRVDDPALQVRFAPEGRHKLEQIVTDLPRGVFTSDDGLGWAYQFWQSKKKDEVNASERKIGGADISPVTQLFTEDYMVKFLLHNTLGAWWAHRHPDSRLNKTFEYLRYREDGTPAAGTFDGWPDKVAEVTMMDPCGGSGHFVVAAFDMFTQMRMEEEGLSAAEAGNAVIRDNVHMLELDPRCTQIAAFNLALTAWKLGGYRELSVPNIACSGIAVEGQLNDWLKLAGDDKRLGTSLTRLYNLFRNAPTLGSLINPTHVPVNERMFSADYDEVLPLFEEALQREQNSDDLAAAVMGETARAILQTARLLGKQFTLVATNVPYLGRGNHAEKLREFCESHHPDAKNDLATVFLERCLGFCTTHGTCSIVLPQNWLFLTSFRKFREKLLKSETWHLIARLGPGAFETISGEVVKAILISLSREKAATDNVMYGLDVAAPRIATEKAAQLQSAQIEPVEQARQLQNPNAVISPHVMQTGKLLGNYAGSYAGLDNGDTLRFRFFFWEMPILLKGWIFQVNAVKTAQLYSGREQILRWEGGKGALVDCPGARLSNIGLWGSTGVYVSRMNRLRATLCLGTPWDRNGALLIPRNGDSLRALWTYASSEMFEEAVRKLNQKLSVAESTFENIPFDLEYWQTVADELYPEDLPEPYSNDATQWLFNGHPAGSSDPLQVAVTRLLGYLWPENEEDGLDAFADNDGIVCLSALAGEQPASERLRVVLACAFTNPPKLPNFQRYRVGDYVPTTPVDPYDGWSAAAQQRLLADADFARRSLAQWLQDGFFKQHVKLFKNRPFIWHIWDGRKDGFAALVNYHKLDHARLERLIYTYLGDWINTQRAEQDQGTDGAEGRLVAALELKKKLELILEGEPPYDIYVRWKPLHEQPIGWNPDLNDGVRLNIRPFVTAGVLRSKFTIHWKKDRGKDADGSERINDLHFTRAEKEAARAAAMRAK